MDKPTFKPAKFLMGAAMAALIWATGSCTEKEYEYVKYEGEYNGGVYVDGQLYIPLLLDEDNGIATGVAGDFYVRYWDITSKSSYSPNVLSSMTEEEWEEFVTKGMYGGIKYSDISYSSVSDFWDNYYGYDKEDEGRLSGTWYYYTEGYERPTLGRETTGWLKDEEWYYSADGFNWRIQPQDSPFDGPYFAFGIDEDIPSQRVFPYDDNGSKTVFILTIPAKEPDVHPTINFYTHMHVYSDPNPLYVPLTGDEVAEIPVTEDEGELYVNRSDISAADGAPNIVAGMTYSQWMTFLSTGNYGGNFYDISTLGTFYNNETEFWNNFWGEVRATNNNSIDDDMRVELYYCNKGEDGEDVFTMIGGFSGEYLREDDYWYSNSGFRWRMQAIGCPLGDPYFAIGLDASKLKDSGSYPYDENGTKYVFLLNIPSRAVYSHPNINLYAIIHVTD